MIRCMILLSFLFPFDDCISSGKNIYHSFIWSFEFNDIILSNDAETIVIRLLLTSRHVWFGFLEAVSITLLLALDL